MRIQSLLDRKADFARIAKEAKTTPEYLFQLAYGFSKASYGMAFRLEAATENGVTRHDLRPDIFGPAKDAA